MANDACERLRAICLALPEVTEKLNHGMPSWVVRRKTVVQFYDGPQRGEELVGMWAPAPAGVLEALVAEEPERFYRPPYGGTGWLPDHVLPPGDYGPPPAPYGGVYEPLVTLSYIAAQTSRVRLGTSILIMPLRDPFLLAKQVATLDRLAGGRCTLGVGIGWEAGEFANVGIDFADRAGRTNEALRLLRHLFETGSGPFEGERFGFTTGVFAPRPTDGLRIAVGGNSDAALRRAARYGDGWQSLPVPPDQFAERAERLRALAERPVEVGVRTEWAEADRSLDDIVAQVRAYEAAGADYVAVWFGDLDGFEPRMTALAEALA